MAYSQPTYRTVVRLSDGGSMGRANPATQPGGFLKGLPSPFWCTDSFKWQILVYVRDNEPADMEGCTATLKARPVNQIAADVVLGTAEVAEGTPGYHNSVTFTVGKDTFPDLEYSGETMMLYAEIDGAAEDVSASVDVQTTLYQTIEFIGPSGTQAATDLAPIPAGRWMGAYDPAYQYWAYDTVSNPDEDGIDCIWMNVLSVGSLGVEPLNANATTWYCIVRDYTGAWMSSVSGELVNKQDNVANAAAFAGPVASATKLFMDGQVGTASQLGTYIDQRYALYAPAATVTAYKVYYNDAGTWTLADPDIPVCETVELWMSLGIDVATSGVVCEGLVTNGSWSWPTVNRPLYLDDSGSLTADVPSSPADDGRVCRIVAWVRSATSVWFDGHVPGGVMDVTAS